MTANPTHAESANGHLHLTVPMAFKNAWVKAAKPQTLSAWAIDSLNRAAMDATSEDEGTAEMLRAWLAKQTKEQP